MITVSNEVWVASLLLALLLGALELGYRAGRRAAPDVDGPSAGQLGAIQGAVLGLLGLLLGFSFAAAGTRFLERQDLIVTEANAIGTAYLRADLLAEPHRSDLRAALKRYTEQRLEVSGRLGHGLTEVDAAEIDRLHTHIWNAASAGVNDRPSMSVAVTGPINEVIDMHAIRLAAARKRLPLLVVGLLIACSALAIGDIGYGCGIAGRRRAPLTVSLALVIAGALWITMDLDNPRAGLLQLNDAPLRALKFP